MITIHEYKDLPANRKIIVDFIVEELRKGNVSFGGVHPLVQERFNLKTRPAFSRYWKMALIKYEEKQAKIIAKNDQIHEDAELSKFFENSLTKEYIFEKLKNIIEFKSYKVGGTIVSPSYSDALKAIDIVIRLKGFEELTTEQKHIYLNFGQNINLVSDEFK